MKNTFEAALEKSISFNQYTELFEQLVHEGKTTGKHQLEGYVAFTKLNLTRYKRALKQIKLSQTSLQSLKSVTEPLTLLILTEAWCGDASQVLPVIQLIDDVADNITVKLVLRDEHEELMNQFLTNGGKAIPKVIILDKQNNLLNSWGPRPSALQKQVIAFKTENPTSTSLDVAGLVQKWYAEDRGEKVQQELILLLSQKVYQNIT